MKKAKLKRRICIIIPTPYNFRLTHVGVEGVTCTVLPADYLYRYLSTVYKTGQLTAVVLFTDLFKSGHLSPFIVFGYSKEADCKCFL